jgi:hypothetical protein
MYWIKSIARPFGFALAAALVASWVVAAVEARADDLHVNNVDGDDATAAAVPTDQSAPRGAFRTINAALAAAGPSDRVIIANTGVAYRESISLQGAQHSGLPDAPFTIVGRGAVIDGTSGIPPDEWQHVSGGTFRFQPARMAYQQLYLEGRPAERQTAPSAELKPLQWKLDNGWIYFCCEPDRVPREYDLRCCQQEVGITLYQVANVTIDGLVIQGFQLDGLNAHDTATNVRITGCTLRGNGRSGLSVGGSSSVTLSASLVGDNGAAQVRTEAQCRLEIENCDIVESLASPQPVDQQGGHVEWDRSKE